MEVKASLELMIFMSFTLLLFTNASPYSRSSVTTYKHRSTRSIELLNQLKKQIPNSSKSFLEKYSCKVNFSFRNSDNAIATGTNLVLGCANLEINFIDTIVCDLTCTLPESCSSSGAFRGTPVMWDQSIAVNSTTRKEVRLPISCKCVPA